MARPEEDAGPAAGRQTRLKLRIVAGELGGRVIVVPSKPGLRATSERVREAWFSALGPRLHGARVVDLYAGSGALGIEALSRGASGVEFVESDRRLAEALLANLETLDIGRRARVCRGDVMERLDRVPLSTWDVALADPPYRMGLAGRLAHRFRGRPFAAVLCVEHEPGALAGVRGIAWSRRYGDTELTFLAADRVGSESEADQ